MVVTLVFGPDLYTQTYVPLSYGYFSWNLVKIVLEI